MPWYIHFLKIYQLAYFRQGKSTGVGCHCLLHSFCREALFPIQQERETREGEGEGQCGKDICCCSHSSGISSPRSLPQYLHAAFCPSKSPLRGLMQPVPQVHHSSESLISPIRILEMNRRSTHPNQHIRLS